MDLLLPMCLRLERDRVTGIAIVPMSPTAPWWTIMKNGLISELQTLAGTSLTIPHGCAKINTHDKLTNVEFGILDIDRKTKLLASTQYPINSRTQPLGTAGFGRLESRLVAGPALLRIRLETSGYEDQGSKLGDTKGVDDNSVITESLIPVFKSSRYHTTHHNHVHYIPNNHQSIMSRPGSVPSTSRTTHTITNQISIMHLSTRLKHPQ